VAKLKAPLLSLGASGAIGKSVVFFPWKGLDVAREYIIPSNPKSTAQQTQRGYLKTAVETIHMLLGTSPHPFTEADKTAWALKGSTHPTPRTWFNEALKHIVEMLIDSLSQYIPTDGTSTPGDGTLAVSIWERFGDALTGTFYYGTSKTSLIHSIAASYAAHQFTATIPNLTNGTKYFWKIVLATPAAMAGHESGIYHGTPTA
jgi:hypothetical protein